MNKKKEKTNNPMKWVATGGLVLLLAGLLFWVKDSSNQKEASNSNTGTKMEAQLADNGDLVIPLADVSEKANFYKVNMDGTEMEVIAIKAADGSVRTAFNTCQVCFDSGKGYYVQEGDNLVCQNCGNQFTASDVEVARGGCNPVPISAENKTIDDTNITISKAFLEEAKVIFENWKK